jgi:hypothetical protein
MSYDIGIYHPSVRARVEGGEEMDEFEHPQLDAAAVGRLVEALVGYGYGAEPSTSECRAFVKAVSGNPIQVHVFATEIAFRFHMERAPKTRSLRRCRMRRS